MNRTKILRARVTDAEYRAVELEAERRGVKLSEVLRDLIKALMRRKK